MASSSPVKLAYNGFEPESGTDECLNPIIFLHGLSASKENWFDIPQTIANATKRKAYALDARNHGDSECSDVFNFDINVDDVFHFMDTIEVPKAIIVGHSMGAITAIKAALRKPERIEKIVAEDMYVRKLNQLLADTITTYLTLAEKACEEVPDEADEEEAKKFIISYVEKNLPPEIIQLKKRGSDTKHLTLKQEQNGRFGFKANFKVILKALEDAETLMSEAEGEYQGPSCFLYGAQSPFAVADDAENIKKHFPNAEFVSIEDATHTVHTDCPQEFADAVLKFLS